MHRVDLQRSLFDRAKELGVHFELGQRVESIDFDQAEITTKTGMKAKGDLIVAADGLWSKSRSLLTGKDDAPRPTGDLAYRVVLDLDQVTDPELRAWISNPAVHFWIGPGAHAVGYSLRAGKMYNIVLLVPDDLPAGVSRQTGSVDEMRALFKDWDPVLNKFLTMVDTVEKWKLMHSEYEIEGSGTKLTPSSRGAARVGEQKVEHGVHVSLPHVAFSSSALTPTGATLAIQCYHTSPKEPIRLWKMEPYWVCFLAT